jgi:DNA-binding NarL/FixJ family response regulator
MKSEPHSRVFLADDSPLIRERLVALLKDLPHVEIVGQSGAACEAIEDIQRLRPSAVVLDISMPGGGGMRVLERVKQAEEAPMVIMLTNFALEAYRRKCTQLGADYFFDKSNEFEKVIDVLREHGSANRR